MINKLFIATLLFSLNAFAQKAPSDLGDVEETNIDYNMRVFTKFEDFNSMISFKYSDQEDSLAYTELTAGGKLRLNRNWKIGGYFTRETGLRHNDDWIKSATSEGWKWDDSSGRSEYSLVPELIVRTLMNQRSMFEFRSRVAYNFYNDQISLKLRPTITLLGISYEDVPLFNLNISYEAYLPLNFGENLIYEHWLYLGLLYHQNKHVKWGSYVGYKKEIWGPSTTYLAKFPNEPYESVRNSIIVGLNLNFYIFDTDNEDLEE